jgi:hypothetical protein
MLKRDWFGLGVSIVVFGVCLACGVAPGLAAPQPSGTTALSAVVLQPAQVGLGYRLQERSDSHCVQRCVTLDLCGFTFKSEKLRTGRLQVNYLRKRSLSLSNEVVSYRSGGTRAALDELDRAVATCPRTPVPSTVQGFGPVTYRLTRLTDNKLLPGYVALRMHVSGKANGKTISGTTVAVYQTEGAVLSGVYTELGPDSTAASQVRSALHAAEASAANLKRAAKRA